MASAQPPKPTWDELKTWKLNLDVVRQAHADVCALHDDILDSKNSFEGKALTLLQVYITLATGAFGASYVVSDDTINPLAIALFCLGWIFALGCFFCLRVISAHAYGARGSSPEIWLAKDKLTGDEQMLPLMLAYLTTEIQARIERSYNANCKKEKNLHKAIVTGVAAPGIFGIALFLAVLCTR